ncbi:DUF6529 family protein [Yinghuangia seranimata]|uniref:DUF6529 family protein n=1 Tax=Yinghuangia seranimata TaxID=408067 RepID=UPI00248C2126|nr:DUF6529 family protein [Yinghuangia seranimata]MDI2131150.1 DUF6529 family protein [Yinghuangia seranimata]
MYDETQQPARGRRYLGLLWALVPAAITGGLYWFGREYTPDYAADFFGKQFADAQLLKAQMGTALLGLAAVQVLLALCMYGVIPGPDRYIPTIHRVCGVLAFALSLPIAIHCIHAYGIPLGNTRVTIHAVAACFMYGAFAAKIIVVRHRRLPGWALPVTGGVLVALIALVWYTAALWDLNNYSVPGLE